MRMRSRRVSVNVATAPAGTEPAVPDRRVVITALGVTQILAWGSSYYLPAVLAQPIAADTGWPLSFVVGGLSLGLLASGIVSPRVGRTIDRIGGRSVLALSSVLIASGQILLALSPSLPVYFLAWLVIGGGMGCGLYDAAFSTLGRIYGASARRAIASVTLFGGFASTVCWPLSAYLVEALGWRGACLAYAGLQIAVALPIHLLALPRAVQESPVAERRPEAEQTEAGRKSRGALLLLGAVLTLSAMISSVISVHLLTILQARGLELAAAVALGALVGPAQVAARVVEMTVGVRFHPIWTMASATALIAGGLLLMSTGLPVVGLALVLYGAGNGVYSIARGTLPLALFGPFGYASLMGKLALPALLASALSPSLGALLLEWGGPPLALGVLAAAATLNVGLVGLLKAAAAAQNVAIRH